MAVYNMTVCVTVEVPDECVDEPHLLQLPIDKIQVLNKGILGIPGSVVLGYQTLEVRDSNLDLQD